MKLRFDEGGVLFEYVRRLGGRGHVLARGRSQIVLLFVLVDVGLPNGF